MSEHRQRIGAVISHHEVIRAASGAPEWREHAAMRQLVNVKRERRNRKQCVRNMHEDVMATGGTPALLPPIRSGVRQCRKALALGNLPADLTVLVQRVIAV